MRVFFMVFFMVLLSLGDFVRVGSIGGDFDV